MNTIIMKHKRLLADKTIRTASWPLSLYFPDDGREGIRSTPTRSLSPYEHQRTTKLLRPNGPGPYGLVPLGQPQQGITNNRLMTKSPSTRPEAA